MDELVTLFGGGGFLGRYVAQELLRRGARVRVAERDPSNAFFLKPLGGLGQTQFVRIDLTRANDVARAAQGSTAVVNLVGVMGGAVARIHVDGARHAAEAAAAVGARAMVHVSAIGADPAAEAAYASSKGQGEAAVRAAFAPATILRPSVLFGREDQFLNRFARMAQLLPLVPVVRAEARFQPAWVVDAARAVADAALEPERHAGRIFELGGPQVMTMAEINAFAARAIGRTPRLLPLPDAMSAGLAKLGFLPGAPLTPDQWLMLQRDNVVAPDADGFAAFGIEPTPMAAVAPGWLVRYRRQGRFGERAAA